MLLGLHYAVPYPNMEFKTGRNLRMSPMYHKLEEAGAIFGQVMGYERPNWFDKSLTEGMKENLKVQMAFLHDLMYVLLFHSK